MTIGSLAVNITATTDKFAKGLASAKGALSSFVSNIGVAQAAVTAFAAYGLQQVVSSAIEAGSALYEMTQKTHVSAEALSALHFAADQLESSATAVDSAIMFMSKTLGKAAAGADPAIKAFNDINIDFEKLQMLAPDQQFLKIIDALHAIKDPAERAAAAQGIFGRGSKELAALIEAGTEQITKMGEAAAKTGAIISSDMAKALDDAGDASKALSTSWEALKVQLVGSFAPLITFTFDLFSKVLTAARATWVAFQELVTGGIRAIVYALDMFQAAWNAIAPSFLELDRQGASTLLDELDKKLVTLEKTRQGILGSGGDNPLAKSAADVGGHVTTNAEQKAADKIDKQAAKQAAKDKKEEEKKTALHTKKANEQLQELINQGNKRGPVLAIAGLR